MALRDGKTCESCVYKAFYRGKTYGRCFFKKLRQDKEYPIVTKDQPACIRYKPL